MHTQAGPSSPVKQLGFNVREGLGPVARLLHPPPIKEATPAEESGEAESWALPARWVADSPLGLADEPSTRSSLSEATTTGFKGFQDYCEAGSFTLAGAQVRQENSCGHVSQIPVSCAQHVVSGSTGQFTSLKQLYWSKKPGVT